MKVVGKEAGRLDASIIARKPATLTEREVRDYLEKHPDFLTRNPELIAKLHTPNRLSGEDGDGVVDFQKFQIEQLQEFLSELDSYQSRLIAAARSNIANQQRIHEAALAALAADNMAELIHTVTHDWCDMLDVDVVGLGLVVSVNSRMARDYEVAVVEPRWIDSILGFDDAAIFRDAPVVGSTLFGPATALVRAEAVARLGGSGPMPEGVLAFGTRDEAGFYPGQGTELLRFLARVLDHCLSQWINADS